MGPNPQLVQNCGDSIKVSGAMQMDPTEVLTELLEKCCSDTIAMPDEAANELYSKQDGPINLLIICIP